MNTAGPIIFHTGIVTPRISHFASWSDINVPHNSWKRTSFEITLYFIIQFKAAKSSNVLNDNDSRSKRVYQRRAMNAFSLNPTFFWE